MRPDGSSRPALDVVRMQVAALAAGAHATGAMPSAGGAPGVRAIPGRVTVRASGAADVSLRCPAPARCSGRLWIEDAVLASVTLVNGRLPGYVLRPVGRAFSVAGRHRERVSFVVPRSVLVHAWGRRLLRLRLALASRDEPFALRARYRADLWRAPTRHGPRRRGR